MQGKVNEKSAGDVPKNQRLVFPKAIDEGAGVCYVIGKGGEISENRKKRMQKMNHRNGNLARIGVYGVGSIVSEQLHWIFREQPVEDYGIDGQIEICEEGLPTGRLLGVQIKCGKSWFARRSEQGYLYTGSMRHLEYWIAYSIPVILILYHPEKRQAFWVPLERERMKLFKNSWSITVPFEGVLDAASREALLDLAAPGRRMGEKIRKLLEEWDGVCPGSLGINRLLEALNLAKRELDVMTACLDEDFLWVLKTLSHRIPVRCLTGGWAEQEAEEEMVRWGQDSPQLQVKLLSGLHEKMLLLDRKVCVYGSANLMTDSWRECRQGILVADERAFLQRRAAAFDKLWREGHPLSPGTK